MAYWLLKTEPGAYSWEQLVAEKRAEWDGVRNYTARNNLAAMKQGDVCFIYHSVGPREVMGTARVVREAYADPTALGDPRGWVCVDVEAVETLSRPVSLDEIKVHPALHKMELLRMSRLSVSPVTEAEHDTILELSEQPAPTPAKQRRAS